MTSTAEINKQSPVTVTDWNGLVQYTKLLAQGDEKRIKICVIDEEQEEIRLQSKEEFDLNIQFSRDRGFSSVKLIVYIDEKFLFHGIYQIEKLEEKSLFPIDKLNFLVKNALPEKWYIPVKQDEAVALCLKAAIQLAQKRQLETDSYGSQFVETILPETFRKLQNTSSVEKWPREIQIAIFELIELLIDLVGTRLQYSPVPVTLLNILATVFDTETIFSKKHEKESFPSQRCYNLTDGEFLKENCENVSYGWLKSFLQRFLAQNGLNNVRLQFENIDQTDRVKAAKEFNSLLKLFSKCSQCIDVRRFRLIFSRSMEQVDRFVQQSEKEEEIDELNKTLNELRRCYAEKNELDQSLASIFNPTISLENESKSKIVIGQKKSKCSDFYERLANEISSLSVENDDSERQNIKKQRVEKETSLPLFNRQQVSESIDEILKNCKKHKKRSSLTSIHKRELKRSNTISVPTSRIYDRSNPEDILRYFGPMKNAVARLYDQLQTAMAQGNLREVVKIEEKLKLINPFSARFIADENNPDGIVMQPGESFRKGWILLNDGSLPWDKDEIEIINVFNGIRFVQSPIISVTAPHEKTTITVNFISPIQPGVYESKWILSYRQRTFGPMFWCSIEVQNATMKKSESFQMIDVPLPDCFDLSKPFRSEKKQNFDRFSNDNESLLTLSFTSENSSIEISTEPEKTIQTEISTESSNDDEVEKRSTPPMDFVDAVVTNIFSVAKQAGSTAKAIFNTLQAYEEPVEHERPTLINSSRTEKSNSVNNVFESICQSSRTSSVLSSMNSNDPMQKLIEMGFANRAKNQRLLRENGNDLSKVISLLSSHTIEDSDWFAHRH